MFICNYIFQQYWPYMRYWLIKLFQMWTIIICNYEQSMYTALNIGYCNIDAFIEAWAKWMFF